jgi:hypothetical protein
MTKPVTVNNRNRDFLLTLVEYWFIEYRFLEYGFVKYWFV